MIRGLLIFTLSLICFTAHANAMISQGEFITYKHGNTELKGYYRGTQCLHEVAPPVILVVPQWKGITAHEMQYADNLADNCYNAFVVDMYGKDIRPTTNEEAAKQSSFYKDNLELTRDRLNVSLDFAKKKFDTRKAAILGFCFGGTMALELARSGADIASAISFHGGLASKEAITKEGVIKASILAHHGDADPYVKAEEVNGFYDEMRAAKTDWQFIRYADAVHAFTQKDAGNDPSKGVAYNEKAAKRSWHTTMKFLEESFAE